MVDRASWVVLGQISGLYGVRGWVRIHSYTEPRGNILRYTPWQIRAGNAPDTPWRTVTVSDGHLQGKGIVAHVAGWDTPEAARALLGMEIAIPREQLPAPRKGEYYWSDLIGLRVVAADNATLGTVASLLETGANDVLVVQDAAGKEHLIPFVDGVIVSVDLDARVLRVDWDINY